MRTAQRLLLSGLLALLLGPVPGNGQTPSGVHHIGFLGPRSRGDIYYETWLTAMRDLGYVEGKNLVIEWRFADGDFAHLPTLAAELASIELQAIVTHGIKPVQALQKATTTTPIVVAAVTDAVGNRIVPSLAKPGGNATGVALLLTETMGKQLELLTRMAPGLARVALVLNPANEAHPSLVEEVRKAGLKMNIQVLPLEARTPGEIERAFSAAVGGLLNYGSRPAETWKGAVDYIDRILHGASPADLPVQQPTKLFLVINWKTAKALGLTIPPDLLVLADKVIE